MEDKINQAIEAKEKANYFQAMSRLYPGAFDKMSLEDFAAGSEMTEAQYKTVSRKLYEEYKSKTEIYDNLMSEIQPYCEKNGLSKLAMKLYTMPDSIEIANPQAEIIKFL